MSTSLSDLLDKPLPNSRQTSPEPQDSPPTGEAPRPADTPAEQPPAAVAAPVTEGQPQTGEQPGATPAPDPKAAEGDPVKAFQKAAEDERRKRQGLEATVEELKRHLEEVKRQQQAPQPQPQKQLEFLDPEGAQHLHGQFTTAIQERDEREFATRVEISQEMMRWRHDDYDEVEKVFKQAADADPTLWVKLREHPMPAKFAYQVGKSTKALNEIGNDPDAYRNRLSEEIRAKVLEEIKAQQPPQPQPSPQPSAPTPPPSLVAVPSVNTGLPNGWQGPSSLDNLLSQPLRGARR